MPVEILRTTQSAHARLVWIVCSAPLALAMSGQAFAQTANSDPATTPELQQSELNTEEIVVTAEHRTSSIQRTSQLMQAITGEDIAAARIVSATDLKALVPNLQFWNTGANTSMFIRGFGSQVSNVRADPAASFTVDGVPINRPKGINGTFFDLERIEVLQGPQGTLYGRNATVGAINIISNKPRLAETAGAASLVVGNYDLFHTEGMINVPFGGSFAVRASFQTDRRDGYLTSGANDADSVAARLRALWQPSSAVSLLLNASYYKDDSQGAGTVPLKGAGGSFLDPSNPWFVPDGPFNLNNQVPKGQGYQKARILILSAQLDVDLGDVRATLIPGYVDTTYDAVSYQGGFLQHSDTPDRQLSLEARLASNGNGPFQWVAGAFFMDDHQPSITDLATASTTFLSRAEYDELDLTSLALFGQATYAIVPELRLLGGLRYTRDKKTMDGRLYRVDLGYNPITAPLPISGSQTYDDLSYKLGLEFDPGPGHMLYGHVSTAYKAGGFQAGAAPNTYLPEKLTAYTIGSKNSFLGRRVTLNVEAWIWKYKNVQQYQFGMANPFGNVQLVTYNAASLVSKGVEVQSAFAIGSNGRLTIDGAHVDARFKSFSLPPFVFGPFNLPASNFAELSSQMSPRWSANIGYEQRFPLAAGDAIVVSANTQLQSSVRLTVSTVPGIIRSGRSISGASATYKAPDERWQLQAWIKNIENKPNWNWGGVGPAGLWADPGMPRTYGASLSAKF